MLLKRCAALLAAAACLCALSVPARAADNQEEVLYCFTQEELSDGVSGVCITALPEKDLGTVMLGTRELRPGDILTADQAAQMTFSPVLTETDRTASVSYLPIYSDRVEREVTVTIAIRGKENKAPAAQDQAVETYKNLPITESLKVSDPEGETMTYTVLRQPRRGSVEVNSDGTFTYTPKKNKVGVDSFVFTAKDPAGNASREATVTVTILKPTDAPQYTDTLGRDCRFAAEWMKNTGIFISEAISGNRCFQPDKDVSRGEFLSMLVSVLEMELDTEVSYTGAEEDVPQWLKPYLAAAMRSGLLSGLPEVLTFHTEGSITGAEAAVMIQNALDLSRVTDASAAVSTGEEIAPQWAVDAMQILCDHGIRLDAEANLTRGDAAEIIYQVSQLAPEAPGTIALRISR